MRSSLSPFALSFLRHARTDIEMASVLVAIGRPYLSDAEVWAIVTELEEAGLLEISRSGRGELMIEATPAGRQLIDELDASKAERAS